MASVRTKAAARKQPRGIISGSIVISARTVYCLCVNQLTFDGFSTMKRSTTGLGLGGFHGRTFPEKLAGERDWMEGSHSKSSSSERSWQVKGLICGLRRSQR